MDSINNNSQNQKVVREFHELQTEQQWLSQRLQENQNKLKQIQGISDAKAQVVIENVPANAVHVDHIRTVVHQYTNHRTKIDLEQLTEMVLTKNDKDIGQDRDFAFEQSHTFGKNIPKKFVTDSWANEASKHSIHNKSLYQEYRKQMDANPQLFSKLKQTVVNVVKEMIRANHPMRFISPVGTIFTMNNKNCNLAWLDVISCIDPDVNPFFTTILTQSKNSRQVYYQDFYQQKLSGFVTQINNKKLNETQKKTLTLGMQNALLNYCQVNAGKLPTRQTTMNRLFENDKHVQYYGITFPQLMSFMKQVIFKPMDSPNLMEVCIATLVIAQLGNNDGHNQYYVKNIGSFQEKIKSLQISKIAEQPSEAGFDITQEVDIKVDENNPIELETIQSYSKQYQPNMAKVDEETVKASREQKAEFQKRQNKRLQLKYLEGINAKAKPQELETMRKTKVMSETSEIKEFLKDSSKYKKSKDNCLFCDIDISAEIREINVPLDANMIDSSGKIALQEQDEIQHYGEQVYKTYVRDINTNKEYGFNSRLGKYQEIIREEN